MSDIPPGTMIGLEIIRRFHHYNVGDKIAEPIDQARELVAKRLARTTGLQYEPGTVPRADDATVIPQRVPTGVVKK